MPPHEPDKPLTYWDRRRAKIRAEIERNRRGDHTVPTWVLVVILLGFIGLLTWALLS
jgi:hypothetical protein